MQPTLLILAAGMGSRYGGIKQLDRFGPNGETLMDYSLFDAIRAGFYKVIFIVRDELLDDFKVTFDEKLAGKIDVNYVIQKLTSFVPAEAGAVHRTKPWGTGHAMLCAKDYVQTPFAVINADDYYGVDAFKIIHDFLTADTSNQQHGLVGYDVKNTLSDHGSVSRGICEMDTNGQLRSVVERTNIYEIAAEGNQKRIVYEEDGRQIPLSPDTPVSMNFWGFKPSVFDQVQQQFEQYALTHMDTPKAEFYIPTVMTALINTGTGRCQVFQSRSNWFGVTYPADKQAVQQALLTLHQTGVYPPTLWESSPSAYSPTH